MTGKVFFWIVTLVVAFLAGKIVSLAFSIIFKCVGIPVYLGLAFGGIALATAPAPALSIVSEFHTKGPVTDTLLPMALLDDIVGIAVFCTVNACIARTVSGVSLVFTGIICATLEGGGESELAVVVKGTIAAAAVINEIIAVIMAKKGFEKAGEIEEVRA